MADMDTYDDQRGYEGNYYTTSTHATTDRMAVSDYEYYGRHERDYPPRDRSRSPGPDRDGDTRIRDEPLNGRADRDTSYKNGEDHSVNEGSNLFVTGIHPRLEESEVHELFSKHGNVEKCNIMRDPHSKESRGFGFVKMVTAEDAEKVREALQGEVIEGRTLSIEKARRAKPRTPTPGKYFGPPKRDDRPPGRGGYGRDRHDDRSYGRRDDRRGGGYRDRYDDRGYGRRDDYGGRGGDRYGRDRYEDRRGYGGGGGGYGGGYDRAPRGPPADAAAGGYAGSRDPPPARDYDDRPRRTYD